MTDTITEIANEIVARMSIEDIRDYSRADWADGVSAMLVDDWKGRDLDEVLDGIDVVVFGIQPRPKRS